ncbi:MAG: DNA replication/repair protein RecF [Spirochaetaceae bacterium]
MGFSEIRVYQFRNLVDQRVNTDAKELFLVGENGMGKTNFLEAIYYLCYASSFRTRRDDQILRHGKEEMAVHGTLLREGERRELSCKSINRKKEIELDGQKIGDRKELISVMPCVVFCHDDIEFVKGAPEMQRYFLDQTLSMYNPLFIDDMRRYRRILKSRNLALKAGHTDVLEVYDEQLAEAGVHLQENRKVAVEAFNRTFSALFREVSGLQEPLQLFYRPSWRDGGRSDEAENGPRFTTPSRERVLEILGERREQDIYFRTTTSGPHRDKFRYAFGGKDFSEVGSTGQMRLVSLILRVAQARFYQEQTRRLPLLLFDDVLLELDPERRRRFFDAMPEYEQAFFTFLPDEQYERYRREGTILYRVTDGRLTREAV